jgi:hypothetical protein
MLQVAVSNEVILVMKLYESTEIIFLFVFLFRTHSLTETQHISQGLPARARALYQTQRLLQGLCLQQHSSQTQYIASSESHPTCSAHFPPCSAIQPLGLTIALQGNPARARVSSPNVTHPPISLLISPTDPLLPPTLSSCSP